MWFSVFTGSNEPQGCESGSGNTDVEGSSSLKDSTGLEACSDWSDWNLLEKKWKRNRSTKAPSNPVHLNAETFSKETRERKTVTENEIPFFFFFFPERNWGSAFLASPPPSEQSVLCVSAVNGRSVRRSRAQFAQRRETSQSYRPTQRPGRVRTSVPSR